MASSANLGQHLEDYVTDLVKSGRYNSRSEVLREGVRLIEDREKRLAALDLSIARGLADIEAGRLKPARDVLARLAAKYEDEAKDGDR
ncbi:type II toxin-antitoxin system ParD family antitoxin [Pararhizobium sp. YC-54]|uniref:type II toxin-antitoxin system ParD family antitoxin n=1 Tax=Pararhizobium sp. YC-54 TaxID=2986920 RepID=UPI0021F7C4D0|nr:type II toxin-antitoxin system ParD family antitoxin [Pararhizobium sp. YC-54]MCV9998356.1 type II toxin-antitoxin system ParD family antitoxin [Pararhizobium sp. YC-54]